MQSEQLKIKEGQIEEAKKYADPDKEGEVVCFRCGKKIGKKKGINGTTHGICKECYDKEMEKIKNGEKGK